MPVDKNKKKPSKKKKVKTNIKDDKKIKKEIKEAVKRLPSLIVEQIQFEQSEEVEEVVIPHKKEFSRPQYETDEQRKKRRLIWIPVIAITVLIFAMWAWNVMVLFGDANKSQEGRKGIFDIAKESYSEIMDQDINDNVKEDLYKKQKENDEKIKESLQKSLDDLAVNLVGTIDLNTTSTININTTTTQ